MNNTRRTFRPFSAILLAVFCLFSFASARADEKLATAMRELQQLTHQLSLATHHKNLDLSRYYLAKSMTLMEDIQEKIPEDKKMPIAVFIDRFSKPAYFPMNVILAPTNQEYNAEELKPAMDKIIDSCNQCHAASHVGFIKIVNATHNTTNLDFKP